MPDQSKSKKELKEAVRKLKSSRSNLSTDEKQIDELLMSALEVRATDHGALGNRAVKELKRMQTALKKKDTQGQQLSKVTEVLAELDSDQEKFSLKKTGGGLAQGIGRHLPSAGSLIGGLTEANPLLGQALRLGGVGLTGTTRAIKNRAQHRLNQQNRAQGLKEKFGQQSPEAKQLNELNESLGNGPRSQLSRLVKINEEQSERLKSIDQSNDKIEDQGDARAKRLKKQAENSRFAKRGAALSGVGTGKHIGKLGEEKHGSLLSTILEGMGLKKILGLDTLLGGVGALTIVSRVTGMFKRIFGLFGKLLPLAKLFGRFTGIGTIIISVYEGLKGFFDGFANAKEILDLGDKKATLMDKLRAGVDGAIAGLLAPVNWLLKQFGLGFADNQTDLAKKVDHIFTTIGRFFADFFNQVASLFSLENLKTKIIPTIMKIPKFIFNAWFGLINSISKAIFGFDLTNIKDKVLKSVGDVFKALVDKIGSLLETIKGYFLHPVRTVKSAFSGIGNELSSAAGWVLDKVLGRDEAPNTSPAEPNRNVNAVSPQQAQTVHSANQAVGATAQMGSGSTMINAPATNVQNVNNTIHREPSGARNNDNTRHRQRSNNYATPIPR